MIADLDNHEIQLGDKVIIYYCMDTLEKMILHKITPKNLIFIGQENRTRKVARSICNENRNWGYSSFMKL